MYKNNLYQTSRSETIMLRCLAHNKILLNIQRNKNNIAIVQEKTKLSQLLHAETKIMVELAKTLNEYL